MFELLWQWAVIYEQAQKHSSVDLLRSAANSPPPETSFQESLCLFTFQPEQTELPWYWNSELSRYAFLCSNFYSAHLAARTSGFKWVFSKDSIHFWMETRNVTVPNIFQTIKRIFFSKSCTLIQKNSTIALAWLFRPAAFSFFSLLALPFPSLSLSCFYFLARAPLLISVGNIWKDTNMSVHQSNTKPFGYKDCLQRSETGL